MLHYAQEIFEGLKAYRTADGGVTMFRPDANAARFGDSAQRMAMPELPEETFLESLRQLVEIDRDWIPERRRTAASTCGRSCSPARSSSACARPTEYLYVVIASPVGAYFAGGVKPVTVWVSPDYTRAAPGGTGAAKCGGNYAAVARRAGRGDRARLRPGGLPGRGRAPLRRRAGRHERLLRLRRRHPGHPAADRHDPARHHPGRRSSAGRATPGHRVEERPVSFADWQADAASGRLREVFACGTAAVITPIGTVRFPDGEFLVGGGEPGRSTMALRQQLVDIQRGRPRTGTAGCGGLTRTTPRSTAVPTCQPWSDTRTGGRRRR